MQKQLTVRIYGLLIESGKVLLSDEWIRGSEVTKFPGGGLEPGEGPVECLKREFREELDMEIAVTGHFYTTDFFVQSAFDPKCQVIAIYFLVRNIGHTFVKESNMPHDYEKVKGAQSFRWMHVGDLMEQEMSLDTDKVVARMLREGGVDK